MQKLVPHLWYDKEAKEAALFYVSLFENSRLGDINIVKNTNLPDSEIVNFELAGQQFAAISAGPFFRLNQSISFMVACSTVAEIDQKWEALLEGGTVLMELQEYPFSQRYGWIQDRYGLSWQFTLRDDVNEVQKIIPNLLFSDGACGKAEEAIRYYADIFEDSEVGMISKYKEGEAKSSKAKVNYAEFKLAGFSFSAMDNGYDVNYTFNEAFSIIVNCKDQNEIDYFWGRLSAVPEAENCGWLKDKFGVSWQIVPSNMDELLFRGSEDEMRRAQEVLLKMKKIDLTALDKARKEQW